MSMAEQGLFSKAELSFSFPFVETPNTVAPYPMPVRHSLCNFQWRQSLCDVKQKDQMELCVPLTIKFLITLTKVAEKNLRAYKDISNETICSQIYLAAHLCTGTFNCGNFKLSIPLNCGYIVIDERKT